MTWHRSDDIHVWRSGWYVFRLHQPGEENRWWVSATSIPEQASDIDALATLRAMYRWVDIDPAIKEVIDAAIAAWPAYEVTIPTESRLREERLAESRCVKQLKKSGWRGHSNGLALGNWIIWNLVPGSTMLTLRGSPVAYGNTTSDLLKSQMPNSHVTVAEYFNHPRPLGWKRCKAEKYEHCSGLVLQELAPRNWSVSLPGFEHCWGGSTKVSALADVLAGMSYRAMLRDFPGAYCLPVPIEVPRIIEALNDLFNEGLSE